MKREKLSGLYKWLLIISGAALVLVLFTPIWRIDLVAPQYPEGLAMFIYANKLGGNVEIINGLNHYIGMKTLHTEDFIEFTVLPYIISIYAVLFIIAGLIGSRKFMRVLLVLFILFGVVAMVDFWKWEYDYGHNLDPSAPIIVPGMAYQPPLIGFKQLLNFGAWSFPDVGGWIFIGVGVLLLLLVIADWRKNKKKPKVTSAAIGLMALALFSLSGCKAGPEPIRFGKDACDYCKMTISDKRFGAELVTKKHKVYKFDDTHCLFGFQADGTVPQGDVAEIYLTDFDEPHALLNVKELVLLKADFIRGPMGGNIAAFKNNERAAHVDENKKGEVLLWQEHLAE
ncbi:MAG: nitrous oxide reductase accessory protein NosL [Ferruginibacter sp.]|nr:nitrous oxide reductase accessory protein NosL [Ferruginibacter sp.]